MACAMSRGDSTMRSWRPLASSQRTAELLHGWANCCTRASSAATRACRRAKSGALSSTTSTACNAPCRVRASCASARCHATGSTPSGALPVQRDCLLTALPWPLLLATWRSARAACSRAPATACQSAKPRALSSPVASRSRTQSSSCPVVSWRPRNCTPISLSWCASSNTTTRTLGSSSATPDSRTPRSAKNRWWLMTTTSAASASRRAWFTWHCAARGHCAPRQLSRVEVTSGMTGERSSSAGISARSPVRVPCAHCSTRASVRVASPAPAPDSRALWRAASMRCRHR